MEISRDEEGRNVAVLSVEDAVDLISTRVGFADAIRLVAGLIDHTCLEAGELGQVCPDAVLIDFGRLSFQRWI